MTVRVGAVSDTHMPMRLKELPPGLFAALEGVDLLLHAGDVGDLSVLDEVSALAPIVAVHGNDDSDDSQRFLPYTALVTVESIRILLWHGHYQDRREEFASRQTDDFQPKLRHIARVAQAAGAAIAVFGHWHIPLVREMDGVTLVNPGAVASGNAITRQLRQVAATLEIDDAGLVAVRHIDLAHPNDVYEATVDWDAGFEVALSRYSETILAPDLKDRAYRLLGSVQAEDQALILPIVLRLAHRCWAGEFDLIDVDLMIAELRDDPTLSEQDKQRFLALLK